MRAHLARAERANAATLDTVARRMLEVVRDDGLIYTTGTGHSLALVLESFYRAGGLACVYPIYHPALLPLEGGTASTLLERTAGLAQLLLERLRPSRRDLAFVFSNSGVNAVPVELAEGLRSAGAAVVAVVSLPHLRQASARTAHKLDEVADYVLDTLVPYGDASHPVDGSATAPLSSLTGIYLWNLLLVRLSELARREGIELPLWVSANVEQGDERNRSLAERYRVRINPL